jgi:DNA-binding response OmpR family regulator
MEQKTILLVEDDPYIKDLYLSILGEKDYNIDTSVEGDDAYNKISSNYYDLILLDIMLPKMSGLDILDKLSSEGKMDIINKVLMLTNLSQESNVAKAVSYGVKGYLVKSDYTPDQVQREVESHLK